MQPLAEQKRERKPKNRGGSRKKKTTEKATNSSSVSPSSNNRTAVLHVRTQGAGLSTARQGKARQGICDFTKNVQKHVQMMTNTNAPPFQRQTAKAAHNSRMQEHLLHDCASGSGAPRPVVLPSSPSFVQPFLMRNFTMIRKILLFIPSGRALTGTAQSQDVRRLRARLA